MSKTVRPISNHVCDARDLQIEEEEGGADRGVEEADGAGEEDEEGPESDDEPNDEDEEHISCEEGEPSGPSDGTDPVNGDQPEARAPPLIKDPGLPSQEEIDAHNAIGHSVYRSWCEACVDGQGREDAHRGGKERGVYPELGYDYGFLNSRDEDKVRRKQKEGKAVF